MGLKPEPGCSEEWWIFGCEPTYMGLKRCRINFANWAFFYCCEPTYMGLKHKLDFKLLNSNEQLRAYLYGIETAVKQASSPIFATVASLPIWDWNIRKIVWKRRQNEVASLPIWDWNVSVSLYESCKILCCEPTYMGLKLGQRLSLISRK